MQILQRMKERKENSRYKWKDQEKEDRNAEGTENRKKTNRKWKDYRKETENADLAANKGKERKW
jgi:hypothetical protein